MPLTRVPVFQINPLRSWVGCVIVCLCSLHQTYIRRLNHRTAGVARVQFLAAFDQPDGGADAQPFIETMETQDCEDRPTQGDEPPQ